MSVSLCQTFQELAALTWTRIAAAERTGLAWSEETNTETLLMELKDRHPHAVRIVSFKKFDEALNGADWEWWIGSPGAWFGMRVQAKRISLPSEQFNRLQTYRAKKAPKTQIETLIAAAARDNLTPAYCLYVISRKWPRVLMWPGARLTKQSFLSPGGCLIGHAQTIRYTGSNELTRLAPHLVPWHLLVCSCVSASGAPGIAEQSRAVLKASATLGEQMMPESVRSEFPIAVSPVQSKLPDYMAQLMEMPEEGSEQSIRQTFDASNAGQRHLAGLILVNGQD